MCVCVYTRACASVNSFRMRAGVCIHAHGYLWLVLGFFLCTSNASSPHFLHILSARMKRGRRLLCAQSAHKANPSAFNAYIQSIFVGLRACVCLRAGMCVRACVPLRRASDSCSLFTPQPSALPPARHSAAWPLSTSSISKRLNRGGESGRNIFFFYNSSTITATWVSGALPGSVSSLVSVRAE